MTGNVLVAYASKHGSTAEIAEAIGQTIRDAGFEVAVLQARDVPSVDGYDAVVAGSVVQVGHWQGDGVSFLKRFAPQLASKPTWLFSSGPTGGSEKADAEVAKALASPEAIPAPKDVDALATRIGARGHVTFPGKVGEGVGGIFAKWVPKGDWRDLDAIKAWGREIAASLHRAEMATTGTSG